MSSREDDCTRVSFLTCLQDENEEMGKELAEGKLHSLERQTALSRSYAEDVRARYVELEDHLHALDMENESLHQQVSHCTAGLRNEGTEAADSFPQFYSAN